VGLVFFIPGCSEVARGNGTLTILSAEEVKRLTGEAMVRNPDEWKGRSGIKHASQAEYEASRARATTPAYTFTSGESIMPVLHVILGGHAGWSGKTRARQHALCHAWVPRSGSSQMPNWP